MGGMTSLLLLLWLGVTVSTAVDLQKRIIGGQNCQDNERQYHVKLTNDQGNFTCGGSLISAQWILTAAHCWKWGLTAVLRVHPRHGQEQIVPIKERPFMFGDNNNVLHDLMLLRIPNAVNFPTVQLPDCRNRPNIGQDVQIAGHAATHPPHGRKVSDKVPDLQCANIRVHQPCPRLYPHQETFCGETSTVDACPGDSGGGVIFNNRIYGVIVIAGRNVCTRPVEFMDLCYNKYNTWIKKITQTPWERIKNAFKDCFGCS